MQLHTTRIGVRGHGFHAMHRIRHRKPDRRHPRRGNPPWLPALPTRAGRARGPAPTGIGDAGPVRGPAPTDIGDAGPARGPAATGTDDAGWIPGFVRTDIDDGVDVVGHDDEFVDIDARVMRWHVVPDAPDHVPCCVQSHSPFDDLAEQAGTALRACSDEVRARERVVVAMQADRTTVVEIGVELHADIVGACINDRYRKSPISTSGQPVGATTSGHRDVGATPMVARSNIRPPSRRGNPLWLPVLPTPGGQARGPAPTDCLMVGRARGTAPTNCRIVTRAPVCAAHAPCRTRNHWRRHATRPHRRCGRGAHVLRSRRRRAGG